MYIVVHSITYQLCILVSWVCLDLHYHHTEWLVIFMPHNVSHTIFLTGHANILEIFTADIALCTV